MKGSVSATEETGADVSDVSSDVTSNMAADLVRYM